MRKFLIVALIVALASMAFAQEAPLPETEAEALPLIAQICSRLKLSPADSDSATDAFKAMLNARVSPKNAYRIVSEGLEKGLRAGEMTKLAAQVRARIAAGASPEACEEAAKTMLQEQIRERTKASLSVGEAPETAPRTGAPSDSGKQSGSNPSSGKKP